VKMLRAYFMGALLFSALAVAVLFDSVHAQPSIPEFTVKYVDLSYDVPPTYGTDQYTGQPIIIQDGYHVDNRSLQFTIRNQPFTPYTDSIGTQIGLYYNFRVKGAYGTEWNYYPFAPNGVTTRRYGGWFGGNSTESPADLVQSNSEYTTITIQIPDLYNVPMKAQLDVQAQALIGYMEPSDYMMAGHVYVFTGESSDWSSTQTITVGEIQTPTPSPAATPTPTPSPAATPTPTPSPTISPSPLPSPYEIPIVGLTFIVIIFAAGLGLLIYLIIRK
jgi:hypothetical protein